MAAFQSTCRIRNKKFIRFNKIYRLKRLLFKMKKSLLTIFGDIGYYNINKIRLR